MVKTKFVPWVTNEASLSYFREHNERMFVQFKKEVTERAQGRFDSETILAMLTDERLRDIFYQMSDWEDAIQKACKPVRSYKIKR